MTTATLLREYHEALDEARAPGQLTDRHLDFMKRRKISPFAIPAGIKKIRRAHLRRVFGQGSPAECSQALRDALKEIGNG